MIRVDVFGGQTKITDLDLMREYREIQTILPTNELPQWLVEAIHLLDLCELDYPLEGVGMRSFSNEYLRTYHLDKKFYAEQSV